MVAVQKQQHRSAALARPVLLLLLLLGTGILLFQTQIYCASAFGVPSVSNRNRKSAPVRTALHEQRGSSNSITNANANVNNDPRRFVSDADRPVVSAPEGFSAPEAKPLAIDDRADKAKLARNALAFALRLGVGAFCLGWRIEGVGFGNSNDDDNRYRLNLGPVWIRDGTSVEFPDPPKEQQQEQQQHQPLVLYEYDSSPYCKRVRETIQLLDLTVEYRPCPGARQGRFSDELFEATGRKTVPYLYDPNTGEGLFESSDQIEYLLTNYGPADPSTYDRKALWPITVEPFSVFTSTLCALLLGMPGSHRRSNARPDNELMLPLELWGYESSPFVRNVRETLGELCLPHIMVSCARGSRNRDKLVAKIAAASTTTEGGRNGKGSFQVPFLVDPNTGVQLFESEEIVRYLEEVYTTTR
eukprot:jgi/Psemu1/190109/e_gw1.96.97.1